MTEIRVTSSQLSTHKITFTILEIIEELDLSFDYTDKTYVKLISINNKYLAYNFVLYLNFFFNPTNTPHTTIIGKKTISDFDALSNF